MNTALQTSARSPWRLWEYCCTKRPSGWKSYSGGGTFYRGGLYVSRAGLTVNTGGLWVTHDGATIYKGGLFVANTGLTVHDGGALIRSKLNNMSYALNVKLKVGAFHSKFLFPFLSLP